MLDTLKGAEEMIDRLTAELATCRDAVRKHQLVLFDENAKVVKLRGELAEAKKEVERLKCDANITASERDQAHKNWKICQHEIVALKESLRKAKVEADGYLNVLCNRDAQLRVAEDKLENTHSYIDTYDCTGKSAHKFKDDLLRWLATILTDERGPK